MYDLLGNKKIILYGVGAGFITFSVFVLRKYGLKAYIVLDRKFKAGDTHFGIPGFSPLEYKPTNEEKENAVVVVAVGKSQFHEEIFNCLRKVGFKNVILSTDIYEYHLLNPSTELEKKGFNYYLDNRKQIMECLELFLDDLSREIFTRFIQTHMLKKPIQIPHHALEEQYFPRDINLSKGYSRFINCGAYNGDTIMQLNALFGKVDAIACFEPDLENFVFLTQYLCAKHNEIAKSIIAFPCGVFSHETQLRFAGGNEFNSMLSAKGESIIQCVALDHVMPGFKPTFISMDVEGAELEALKGAEMLIKGNKPDLAISVYHAPNHIWDIPLYLEILHLGYKFYLRNYASFSETVLYATI
ncbi:MAG: FkbM family methyltransferase [Candidatus Omnitrophota bacterium]|nr:FkbM family methyltransferase [Candidatus Omnitrophota bacterium]